MFMRMVYDDGLAQAAYIVGCQQTGEAIVIDPERDVDRYIDLAAGHGLRLVATAETHIHADFVSGSRELAERCGAKVYVSDEGDDDWKYGWLDQKLGGGSYDHRLLKDGDSFRVGNIEFRAIHTPGHTPEHIVFLITDHGSGATEPIAMASGDFVFVGDLGRPDLLETAAGQIGAMEPSAHRLYNSLGRLSQLPDFLQIWPAHGAGSACGKALGAVPTSTLGYEKRFNPAILAASDEQGFVDFILAGQPEPSLYFAEMKRVNKVGPAVLGGVPSPDRVEAAALVPLAAGDTGRTVVVDTRPWDEFRAGHIPGSLSFPLIKSFSTDIGSMVSGSDEVTLIVDEEDLDSVVRAMLRIGIDRVAGWCPPEDVSRAGVANATIEELDVGQAGSLIGSGSPVLLDVRRKAEYELGHIPGAVNISHTRLAARLGEVPHGEPVLINCRSGARSARAAAYLKRLGRDVINLKGGFMAWDESGAPTERGDSA